MQGISTAAIVVYRGVSVEETEAFRSVLTRLPDVQAYTAGVVRGQVAGSGGIETATVSLDEMPHPEIVAVPGGMGCHRQEAVADWLRSVSPSWLVTSSTGSALLAAAGLLRDGTAATHWLGGPLLERYGAHAAQAQVVIDGRIITCAGGLSAFRAALVIAEAYGGRQLVARIRAEYQAALRPPEPAPTLWQRLRDALWPRGRVVTLTSRSLDHPVDDSEVLDLGLVTPPPIESRARPAGD
jgi:transcriptional regulator GlxA family with amidase domain